MYLRLSTLGILLLPCLPLTAQSAQDPAAELAELAKEKERLQREIGFVKGRVANAKDTLKNNLGRGVPAFRTIDAGKTTVAAPAQATPPVAPRPARLMADDERSNFTGDTMLVVNGHPIRQAQFDELMAYQATLPGDASAKAIHGMMAVSELVRIETMASSFTESEVEVQAAEALGEIESGKTMAEVAKARGTLRGAPENGQVEITRRSVHGLRIEQVAFSTPEGSRSRPFRHHGGIAILQVDGIERGATPELDKCKAHVVVVPYADPESLAKVESLLANGQVEIVARDKDVMQMLPAGFQDQDEVRKAAAASAAVTMETALAQLEAEIAKLKTSPNEDDKTLLQDLERRREAMKARMEKLRQATPAGEAPPKKD